MDILELPPSKPDSLQPPDFTARRKRTKQTWIYFSFLWAKTTHKCVSSLKNHMHRLYKRWGKWSGEINGQMGLETIYPFYGIFLHMINIKQCWKKLNLSYNSSKQVKELMMDKRVHLLQQILWQLIILTKKVYCFWLVSPPSFTYEQLLCLVLKGAAGSITMPILIMIKLCEMFKTSDITRHFLIFSLKQEK